MIADSTDNTLIRANDLRKTYSRGSEQVQALRGLTFQIQAQERIALLGRSGSGKTTLLNLLAGLDRPTSGTLNLGQVDLSNCDAEALDHYRRHSVGVVFQQFRLIRHQSAKQNIALPLKLAGVGFRERRRRVKECLELVGLSHRGKHRPTQLSGGEQQRVAVARAIANRPKLILADEPTGNLDSANAERVMDLLCSIHREVGAALVLVTHDETLASKYTDRILRVSDGEIITDQHCAEAPV